MVLQEPTSLSQILENALVSNSFLPTVSQANKIENIAFRIIALIGAFILDIATCIIRASIALLRKTERVSPPFTIRLRRGEPLPGGMQPPDQRNLSGSFRIATSPIRTKLDSLSPLTEEGLSENQKALEKEIKSPHTGGKSNCENSKTTKNALQKLEGNKFLGIESVNTKWVIEERVGVGIIPLIFNQQGNFRGIGLLLKVQQEQDKNLSVRLTVCGGLNKDYLVWNPNNKCYMPKPLDEIIKHDLKEKMNIVNIGDLTLIGFYTDIYNNMIEHCQAYFTTTMEIENAAKIENAAGVKIICGDVIAKIMHHETFIWSRINNSEKAEEIEQLRNLSLFFSGNGKVLKGLAENSEFWEVISRNIKTGHSPKSSLSTSSSDEGSISSLNLASTTS